MEYMTLAKFDNIDKTELSMIEVAQAILQENKTVMEFNELILAVQEFLNLSEDDLDKKMSIFYTEINIDGSFISLGENRWGLRAWYAVDEIDEEIISALEENEPQRKKRKKHNAFVTSEDDLDYSNDDPEDDELDSELDDELDNDLMDYDTDLDTELNEDSGDLGDLSIVSDEEAFEEI